jgi:TIR domain
MAEVFKEMGLLTQTDFAQAGLDDLEMLLAACATPSRKDYSRADSQWVGQLRGALVENGFSVWIDQEILPGRPWYAAIDVGLSGCADFPSVAVPGRLVVLLRGKFASNRALSKATGSPDRYRYACSPFLGRSELFRADHGKPEIGRIGERFADN